MTCPPDALRTGRDLVVLEPGQRWTGSWRVRRADRGGGGDGLRRQGGARHGLVERHRRGDRAAVRRRRRDRRRATRGRASADGERGRAPRSRARRYVQADVSDEADVARLVATTLERHGRLDVLVNNAGTTEVIAHHDLDAARASRCGGASSRSTCSARGRSRVAAMDALRAARGAVVNVSSIAGLRPTGSSIPYAASKAALNHLTVLLAKVVGPEVRVNAVAPGLVDTPWTKDWDEIRGRRRRTRAAQALRAGPSDVAEVVVALAAAPYVTGQVVARRRRPHARELSRGGRQPPGRHVTRGRRTSRERRRPPPSAAARRGRASRSLGVAAVVVARRRRRSRAPDRADDPAPRAPAAATFHGPRRRRGVVGRRGEPAAGHDVVGDPASVPIRARIEGFANENYAAVGPRVGFYVSTRARDATTSTRTGWAGTRGRARASCGRRASLRGRVQPRVHAHRTGSTWSSCAELARARSRRAHERVRAGRLPLQARGGGRGAGLRPAHGLGARRATRRTCS